VEQHSFHGGHCFCRRALVFIDVDIGLFPISIEIERLYSENRKAVPILLVADALCGTRAEVLSRGLVPRRREKNEVDGFLTL
jgi:hypothetical protein